MNYDMSIHTNPSAVAWARFYRETKAQSSDPTNFDDEENMVGWFANAMMAMHDYMRPDLAPVVLPDGSACFVADVFCAPPRYNCAQPHGKRTKRGRNRVQT